MGRKGPREKTKTVLKTVCKTTQLGNMQNLKNPNFLNKNHPTEVGWADSSFDWLKQQSYCIFYKCRRVYWMALPWSLKVEAGPGHLTLRVRWPRNLGLHCWNISHCYICVLYGFMAGTKDFTWNSTSLGYLLNYARALKPEVGWAMLLWTIVGTCICSGSIYVGHATW